ncbi:MAG: hypothetical protein ACJA1C_002388 [Crocinitomicaceae bacterium]|jgi:hypothetical protein
MKELHLKYLGKKDKCFVFLLEDTDEIIRFHHVRSELIHDFELLTEKFTNRLFKVNFFVLDRDNITTRIISDLLLIE